MNRTVQDVNTPTPLFSIGVVTYNRKNLLKQTLSSILNQTFGDFEIIVGNDYPQEKLSAEVLGISDPRLRFINHEKNMGELENMNYLLGMARGRYFSWQFDDDPCDPNLLRAVYSALEEFDFPSCVFSSYSLIYGTDHHSFKRNYYAQAKLFSGKEFLRGCLSGRLKAMGCCGFYDSGYLKEIEGVHRLSDGPMALYTENLLLIQNGLLNKVAYIDAPLVSSRVHRDSWTCSSNDVEMFKQAGRNLIKESIVILSKAQLKDDFGENIASLLEFVLGSVVVKSAMRSRRIDDQEIQEYMSFIEREFQPLRGSPEYECAICGLNMAYSKIPMYIMKVRLKRLTPPGCLKFVHIAQSIYQRYVRRRR
jgi:hypothetical protein